MEYKLFLDTNALLNLQKEAFKEPFVISQKTLEEIENIKTSGYKDGEVKYKARQVAHLLDEYYGKYEVVANDENIKQVVKDFQLEETPDNIILASAYFYNLNLSPIIVCTDDLNCKFISKNIFKLNTKGVNELNIVKNIDEYTGYKEVTLSDKGMSNFSYKKTTTTAMKVAGIIDTDNMTVDVDGEIKKLSTLLSDFNGASIEINVKVKDEEEIDEPTESSNEE